MRTRSLPPAAWRLSLGPFLIVAALSGCAHRPAPPVAPATAQAADGAASAPARGRVASIGPAEAAYEWAAGVRATWPALRQASGSTPFGTSISNWTAYYEGDTLRAIHEHVDPVEYSPWDQDYFFAGGELRVFNGRGAHALTGPGRERGPYEMAIAYAPGGTMVGTRKTVSGIATEVEESEITGARGRAEWLIARVREASSPH